jgi:hypothetical protein
MDLFPVDMPWVIGNDDHRTEGLDMPQTPRSTVGHRHHLSRRNAVKGGVIAAAGVLATLLSSGASADAVTPLDVKRTSAAQVMAPSITQPAAPLAPLFGGGIQFVTVLGEDIPIE